MGGRGSGGRRTGAGRKRQSALERAISGDAGKRGVVLQHPSSTAVAPVVIPDTCTGIDELTVVPFPSCPELLLPQHLTAPDTRAQLSPLPAESAVTPEVNPDT